MKKILLILLLLTPLILADNYSGSESGTTVSSKAYFSTAKDSSMWIFGFPDSSNFYDTVWGYAWGAWQYAVGIDLDSIGNHDVVIYGYSSGSVDDTIVGDWFNGRAIKGDGSEAETLIVLASADTTAIESARITVRTLNQSTVIVDGLSTNVNGLLIIEIGDGVGTDSFYVATTANNYTYSIDTIAVASGGGTDTIWMTAFDPGSPTRTGTSKLYVWTNDVLGDTLSGATLRAVPIVKGENWEDSAGIIVIPWEKTATTDSLGYASLDLYRSAYVTNADGDSLKYNIYLFKGSYPHKFVRKNFVVTGDSLRLRRE